MKHLRLLGVAFVAMLMLGVISASAASAASPELTREGGGEIKVGTPVVGKSTGAAPKLAAGATTVTCTSAESTKGEVLSSKSISILILFKGCKDSEGNPCNSEGQVPESIQTALLLLTLWKKGTEFKSYFRNAASKNLTGELATFKCGELAFKTTGCVSETANLNAEKNMLEGTTEAKAVEVEENETKSKCELKTLGVKATETASLTISFNTEGKLLQLELK